MIIRFNKIDLSSLLTWGLLLFLWFWVEKISNFAFFLPPFSFTSMKLLCNYHSLRVSEKNFSWTSFFFSFFALCFLSSTKPLLSILCTTDFWSLLSFINHKMTHLIYQLAPFCNCKLLFIIKKNLQQLFLLISY